MMFSFLNLIGQGLNYLGYFSLGSRSNRILNRIYIGFGGLGDLYLFYIGHRFVANGYSLRGSLLLLIALVLGYLLYINFYYYFLEREAPFDISPGIRKKLGLSRFNHGPALDRLQNLPHERAFVRENVRHAMPAEVAVDATERLNLQRVVQDLVARRRLRVDYGGLSRRAINRLASRTNQPVYAIGAGALLPGCRLRITRGKIFIDAGDQRPVGQIRRAGFQTGRDLIRHTGRFHLELMSVILLGGPYWIRGRSRLYWHRQPYTVHVNVKLKENYQTFS